MRPGRGKVKAVSNPKARSPSIPATASASAPAPAPAPASARANATAALVLAMLMALVPALGFPGESMLQDSFKSALLSTGVLTAAVAWLWMISRRPQALRFHAVQLGPLTLMLYALGSMGWSHAYLGGVEAVRWFILGLLLWMALNVFTARRLPWLALGLTVGALGTAFVGAMQFWFDVGWFPQGPNPASTFVNRNFAAEFVVCALPYTLFLWGQQRKPLGVLAGAAASAFLYVFVMMTGTRSALMASLSVGALMLAASWALRRQWACGGWSRRLTAMALAVFVAGVVGLGLIPTGNERVKEEARVEGRGMDAMHRGFLRSRSLFERAEYTERSFSVRWVMWSATGRLIAAHPLAGVGAGAWEVDIPLYQSANAQLETDYYAHNEALQLVAEYGLLGWVVLAALLGFVSWHLRAWWQGWRALAVASPGVSPGGGEADDMAVRTVALLSLWAFGVVSLAGFPSRLAATGATLVLALALLAGARSWASTPSRWAAEARLSNVGGNLAVGLMIVCLVLSLQVVRLAAEAENKLVQAVKIALTINRTGQSNDPRWDPLKAELLQNLRDGIAINPHYRKLTPMAADEMSRWNDWTNAIWVWESVVESRPHVVAILTNIVRGYIRLGQVENADLYLAKARAVNPGAESLGALEVRILGLKGREDEALVQLRRHLREGRFDEDMLGYGYSLAQKHKDVALGLEILEARRKRFPATEPDCWLKTANILGSIYVKDEQGALKAYIAAVLTATPAQRAAVLSKVPPAFMERVQVAVARALPASSDARPASP